MNFVEKIFLFTLTFSFLLMGFMFAILFDVGDMFSSQISGGNSFRNAMAESAIALLDLSRRVRGNDSSSSLVPSMYVDRNADFGAPATMAAFVKGARKRVDRSMMVKLRREELKRLGITCTAYIEMEALNKDRTSYFVYIKRIGDLVAVEEYDEAIETCLTAIAEAGNMNLYILRDIWARLSSVYYQAGRTEDGIDSALKYAAIERAILVNKEKAGIKVSRSDWRRIDQLEKNAQTYYSMSVTPDSSVSNSSSMSESEKREARLELVNALEKGEITKDEFDLIKERSGL